jgi:hypothetical protein
MPDGHDLDCDQQHTPRQACNKNLAPASEGVIVSPPEPAAPPSPPANPEPVLASSVVIDAEVIIEDADERASVATEEMPAPSPWASRAWEDTAAAVGATATPAPPPEDSSDPWDQDFNEDESRGHAGIVVIALIVLVVIFILLRRRRR